MIPWNILLCSNLCHYYNLISPEYYFVMLLLLVCPCLQEKMRRHLLCKAIILYFFAKLIVPKHFIRKGFLFAII